MQLQSDSCPMEPMAMIYDTYMSTPGNTAKLGATHSNIHTAQRGPSLVGSEPLVSILLSQHSIHYASQVPRSHDISYVGPPLWGSVGGKRSRAVTADINFLLCTIELNMLVWSNIGTWLPASHNQNIIIVKSRPMCKYINYSASCRETKIFTW